MDVHTYMLFVGLGQKDSENLAAVTISAAKIVEREDRLELFGPDGQRFAELVRYNGTNIRVVGK